MSTVLKNCTRTDAPSSLNRDGERFHYVPLEEVLREDAERKERGKQACMEDLKKREAAKMDSRKDLKEREAAKMDSKEMSLEELYDKFLQEEGNLYLDGQGGKGKLDAEEQEAEDEAEDEAEALEILKEHEANFYKKEA